MRTRCVIDYLAMGAIALGAMALLPGVPTVLFNAAGLVLCFGVLGVVWACAILPSDATTVARFVAVVASPLVAGVVGGLVLNFLPGGLNRINWVLFAVVVTFVGYAAVRRRRVGISLYRRSSRQRAPSRDWLKVGAAGVVLAVAVAVSATSVKANEPQFTELWFVPDNPRNSPLRAVHATVGVKSHESVRLDVTIVVDTGRRTYTRQLALAPQQEWSEPVIVEGIEARASLYRGDAVGAPYRTVWIASQ